MLAARKTRSVPLSFAFLCSLACSRVESNAETSTSAPAPRPSAEAIATAAAPPLVLARGVRFVKPARNGDFASAVRAERVNAATDGRDVVVYVGASWCEPCQRFHQAAQRGELDDAFPTLTLVEVDLDEDRDRLVAAGYSSKLIPLFVKPSADGHATDVRFEGGVKGDGAVANIIPRLRKLVAK